MSDLLRRRIRLPVDEAAVPPDLVRLSCGIESPADLVEDLQAAIAAAAAAA